MNERNDRQARLLAETFHDDWTNGHAGDFARLAAARARYRRRTRRALSIAGGAALIAVAAFVVPNRPAATPTPARVATATPPPNPAKTPAYEVISDDELLAQLRDRPLLVVKKDNGSREIIVLPNE